MAATVESFILLEISLTLLREGLQTLLLPELRDDLLCPGLTLLDPPSTGVE